MNILIVSVNYSKYKIIWKYSNELIIEYKIYEISPDEIDEDLIMEGFVKWDGCSNWNLGKSQCMLHACSRKDLEYFYRLPKICWIHASKHIERFECTND